MRAVRLHLPPTMNRCRPPASRISPAVPVSSPFKTHSCTIPFGLLQTAVSKAIRRSALCLTRPVRRRPASDTALRFSRNMTAGRRSASATDCSLKRRNSDFNSCPWRLFLRRARLRFTGTSRLTRTLSDAVTTSTFLLCVGRNRLQLDNVKAESYHQPKTEDHEFAFRVNLCDIGHRSCAQRGYLDRFSHTKCSLTTVGWNDDPVYSGCDRWFGKLRLPLFIEERRERRFPLASGFEHGQYMVVDA